VSSLETAITTARSALQARQLQLEVTGNNLANADRLGYHRQTAVVQSATPWRSPTLEIGTGVTVTQVSRAYDSALEASLRDANQAVAYSQTQDNTLVQMEGLLAPGGASALATATTHFAAALQGAANNPAATDTRRALLSAATTLANQVQADDQTLANLQADLADPTGHGAIADTVDQVNTLAGQIADLNRQIAAAEAGRYVSQPANALRDQRDELTGQLAGLAQTSVVTDAAGGYQISIGGDLLVVGGASRTMQLQMSAGGPAIQWADNGATANVAGGTLGAGLDTWSYLGDRRSELDSFAATLADTVNTGLANGYAADGSSGQPLFTGTTAATLAVAFTQPAKLALSDTAGATGNGNAAMAIYTALGQPQASLGDESLLGFGDSLANRVATDRADTERSLSTATTSQAMFTQAIASRSGVSLDDEMVNMLQMQRAYQSAAKFLSTVDSLYDTVLKMF